MLEENCPGPLPQSKRKDKDFHNDNKISKLMGKIRPRTSTDISACKDIVPFNQLLTLIIYKPNKTYWNFC